MDTVPSCSRLFYWQNRQSPLLPQCLPDIKWQEEDQERRAQSWCEVTFISRKRAGAGACVAKSPIIKTLLKGIFSQSSLKQNAKRFLK